MARSAFVRALAVLLVLVAMSAAGCGAGTPSTPVTPDPGAGTQPAGEAPAGAKQVSIKDYAFDPASIEIAVGETVTWSNGDAVPHTVTGSGGIDSAELELGATYSKTFDAAGTYDYECTLHPGMNGTVVVK